MFSQWYQFIQTIQEWLAPIERDLQIIGAILSVVFLIGIVILYQKRASLDEAQEEAWEAHFQQHEGEDPRKHPLFARWEEIRELFLSPSPNDWRVGLIEADALMEQCIDQHFILDGESFGEKLKQLNRKQFPLLDLSWDLHKLRNEVAHASPGGGGLSHRRVIQALRDYEYLFRNLPCFPEE